MSDQPPNRAPANPRRLSRPKRILFYAIYVLILWLVTELLVFAIFGIYSQKLNWMASIQGERDDLLRKLESRESIVLQVHPFVGYTEVPPKGACGGPDGKLHDCAINKFGYVDDKSPIQARSPGKAIIGIMGGSVACGFYLNGTARLRPPSKKIRHSPARIWCSSTSPSPDTSSPSSS